MTIEQKKIQSLEKTLSKILPQIVRVWNEEKLPLCEQLWETSFESYFEGRKTEEKTKIVAPILDVVIARHIQKSHPKFVVDEGTGRDYNFDGMPMECKISLSTSNSWTGNGYAKTPWHILFKFEMNEQGQIISFFCMIVDLAKCKSNWTVAGTKSNFSGLKFYNEDIDHLNVVSGTLKKKQKYVYTEMLAA